MGEKRLKLESDSDRSSEVKPLANSPFEKIPPLKVLDKIFPYHNWPARPAVYRFCPDWRFWMLEITEDSEIMVLVPDPKRPPTLCPSVELAGLGDAFEKIGTSTNVRTRSKYPARDVPGSAKSASSPATPTTPPIN
jgi:hypothetical protein